MNDLTIGNPAAKMPDDKRSDLADRDTPFIRNCWYVAARGSEVNRVPLARTILDEDIVFYRKEDGTAVALQNRCAHRSYPLSASGELNGDRIICGYHGFEYNPDGKCALVPALGRAQPGIRVQPYPLVEVGPFLWIWMGPADAPDHGKLIGQPWFADGWRWVSGYFPVEGNYLGLHENLMDLSHFPFLHTFAKGQTGLLSIRPEVETGPGFVKSTTRMDNFPLPPENQSLCGLEGRLSDVSELLVETPAMHVASSKHTDSSNPPKHMHQKFVHCITPASRESTHYFWAVSRDVALDSDRMDELSEGIANYAFEEDKKALEEIERMYARDHRPDFRERLVVSDAGGVQVLRLIAGMARQDAEDRARAGLPDQTGKQR